MRWSTRTGRTGTTRTSGCTASHRSGSCTVPGPGHRWRSCFPTFSSSSPRCGSSLGTITTSSSRAGRAETRGAPVVFTLHDISQLEPPAEEEGPSLRERLGVPGPVVLYVGNLEPYQGIDLLLESFVIASREHEGLTLAIAGGQDGDIRAYRRKAERLGIGDRTHFLGRWPVTKLGAR